MLQLNDLPLQVYVFAGILLVLAIGFLLFFLLPGLAFRFRLFRLLAQLNRIKDSKDRDLDPLFSKDNTLAHLWTEYKETLHKQKEVNPRMGVQEVVALRSTVPAEVFFNTQALVDGRLRTEFFKHLPGIFTGIGIIGTFSGLILGLKAFQVSESASVVRESLNSLLHGVWEAFLVSAFAIALAMVVILFEKLLLASLYRKVEELAQTLDSLFEAGAGEEYLSRLVKASEDSAAQAKILKDALVNDLKQVLTELTDKQIAATAAGNAQLGQQISGSLQSVLKDPFEKIASAVNQVSQDQGTAVTRLLTDVLSGFSQRLQDLFGGQISGINQLQQQTIAALQAAVVKMEQMASDVQAAGQKATDAIATKLLEAMDSMKTRQEGVNHQMIEFLSKIRTIVGESQSEANQNLRAALTELSEQVSSVIAALKTQMEQAASAHIERETRVGRQTEQTISKLGGQVDTVLAEVAKATAEMHASVEAMRGATTEAVTKMNSGAETLYAAANDFAKAGQGVTTILTQATNVANQLSQAAGSVVTATRSLDAVLNDYRATRDTVSQMISSLQATVEAARKEAAMTSDVLQRIEGATSKLAQAQHEADRYLERVSQVLAEAHQSFADNMTQTVSTANTQFHESLSKATGLLRDAIQELEVTFQGLEATLGASVGRRLR
jgi:hypothetical protein